MTQPTSLTGGGLRRSLRLARPLALFALFLLLPGCIAFSTEYEGNPIRREVVSQIEVGKTTRAEVLELLGAPLAAERVDVTGLAERLLSRVEGEELALKLDPALFDEIYIYQRTQIERFGVILILYNRFKTDRRSDRLAIFFDPDGVVLGVGWTPGTDEL